MVVVAEALSWWNQRNVLQHPQRCGGCKRGSGGGHRGALVVATNEAANRPVDSATPSAIPPTTPAKHEKLKAI